MANAYTRIDSLKHFYKKVNPDPEIWQLVKLTTLKTFAVLQSFIM